MADELTTADILKRMALEGGPPKAPWRGPGERPVPGPNEPDNMPKWYRDVQPYPVNIPAAIEGLGATAGMTAGPAGAITSGLRYGGDIAKSAANSPLGAALLGGLGLSMAGASDTNSQELKPMDRLLEQQKMLLDARSKAQAGLDAQLNGKKGATAGEGPKSKAFQKDIDALDAQLTDLRGMIRDEQRRDGDREKARLRKEWENSAEGKAALAKERAGLPTRERLWGDYQDMAMPAAFAAGTTISGLLTKRSNNIAQHAIDRYMAAQRAGDPAMMALAQKAVQNSQNPGIGTQIGKVFSAGLPVEMRGYELLNDLHKDPESKAFKDANALIHDPMRLGVEGGSALATALTAYGLGSKIPRPADKDLGKAIAEPNPYAKAEELATNYKKALDAGVDLKNAHPGAFSAQPMPPEAQPGMLAGLLRRLVGKGEPSPTPTVAPPTAGQNPPAPPANPAPAPAAPANPPNAAPAQNQPAPSLGSVLSSEKLGQILEQEQLASTHHSNFQPRAKGGEFKKGKPKAPSNP